MYDKHQNSSSARKLLQMPAAPLVTLDEAKAHLRVDFSRDDDLINAVVAAVCAQIDAAGGGWLGRALRPQQWRFALSEFPFGPIWLPYPPVTAIDRFAYDDGTGVERVLAAGTGYRAFGLCENKVFGPQSAFLMPPVYQAWPSARCEPESIRIDFTAGYPTKAATDPDFLPAQIRAWALLNIGTLYAQRETFLAGQQLTPLPDHVLNMLTSLRVWK